MATFSNVENLACCERNFLLEQSRKSYVGYARVFDQDYMNGLSLT